MKKLEKIEDIEKRMRQLMKDEKDKLLDEVSKAIDKKKATMSNPDDEEY